MIETKVDGMVGRATDEIMSFIDSPAVKNPVLELFAVGAILFVLAVPILFGLLVVSVTCREIEVRRATGW